MNTEQIAGNLLAPSAQLFAISRYLPDDEMSILISNVINENYLDILEYLNELIASIMKKDLKVRTENELVLSILIDNFRKTLRDTYLDYEHLQYHYEAQKSLSVFRIIEDTLTKYNISDSATIAKEVHNELFVNNLKSKKEEIEIDEDDLKRNIKLMGKQAKVNAGKFK